MTRIATAVTVLLSVVVVAQPQTGDPMLARIRAEGLEHSQVAPVFDMLTVTIGPRLTASPAHKRAAEWTRDRLASYGLDQRAPRTVEIRARLDAGEAHHRDDRAAVSAADWLRRRLVGGDRRGVVAAPVFLDTRTRPQELTAMAPQMKGAIVMTQPILTNFVRKDRPQPSDPDYVPMSAAYATSARPQPGPAPVGETAQQRNSASPRR